MTDPRRLLSGRFIWHDLAAADPAAALDFYGAVFGWTAALQRQRRLLRAPAVRRP